MIRYKCKRQMPWVIAVECPVPGYPNRDADDEVQYCNSHFDTEREAWANLLENTAAGQSLAVGEYEDAKAHLEAKTKKLAERAAEHSHATEAFEQWERGQEETV